MRKLRVKVTPEDVKRICKELGEKSTVRSSSDYSLSEVGDWSNKAKVMFFDGSVFYCRDATVEERKCSGCEFYIDESGGCLPGSSLVTVDAFIEEIIRELPVKKEISTVFSEGRKQQRVKGLVRAINAPYSNLCPSDFGMTNSEECNRISCTECAEAACKQFFEDLGV